MHPPRRHRNSNDYVDGAFSSGDESSRPKPSRTHGHSPKLQRGMSENSLVGQKRRVDDVGDHDSQLEWDTDYDPRDKYYLSGEEDPLGLHLSERRDESNLQPGRDGKSNSRHGSAPARPSSRSGHGHSRSHGGSSHGHHRHSYRKSHSQPHSHSQSSDVDDEDQDTHRRITWASDGKPRPSASHPRPGTGRASSSHQNASRRPAVKRAASPYVSSRPRARTATSATSHPSRPARGSSSQHDRDAKAGGAKKTPWKDFPWEEAAKVAIQAGGAALMKVGTEQMPWQVKGTKIASAALGAAVVDHVLKPKKKGGVKYAAIRHLAEVAVGNMVVSPAIGKMSNGGKGRKR